MRLYRHIKFDFINGFLRRGKRYVIWFMLSIIASLEFSGVLTSMEITQCTFGDYLLYIFGGMQEYIPGAGHLIRIPYLWLINHIGILYFTLHDMHDDLKGFGQQVILRSGSRAAWWLSKCIWSSVVVAFLYFIAWGTIFLAASVKHSVWSFEISSFMTEIMNFVPNQEQGAGRPVALEITLLPLLVTLAMSQVQMLLCLIIGPAGSYVISIVLFISSAYYLSPCLLGNYAMALRSDKIISDGVSWIAGIKLCAALMLAGIVLGIVFFQKYNILNKED